MWINGTLVKDKSPQNDEANQIESDINSLISLKAFDLLSELLLKRGGELHPRFWVIVGKQLAQLPIEVRRENPGILLYQGRYSAEASPVLSAEILATALQVYVSNNDEKGELLARLYLLELQTSLVGGTQHQLNLPRLQALIELYSEQLEVLDQILLLTYLAVIEIYYTGNAEKIDSLLGRAELLQQNNHSANIVLTKLWRTIDHVYNLRRLPSDRAMEILGRIPRAELRPTQRSQIYAVQANWLAMVGRPAQLRRLRKESSTHIDERLLDEGHTGAYLDHWHADRLLLIGLPELAVETIDRGKARYAVRVEGDLKRSWHWTAAHAYAEAGITQVAEELYDAIPGFSPLIAVRYRQMLVMGATCINLGRHAEARLLLDEVSNLEATAYIHLRPIAHGFSYLNESASGNLKDAKRHLQVWVDAVSSGAQERFITVGYSKRTLLSLIRAGHLLAVSDSYDTAVRRIASTFMDVSLDNDYLPIETFRLSVASRDVLLGADSIRLTKMHQTIMLIAALSPNQAIETSRLCQALWPGVSNVENRLYAASFRLKKMLNDAGLIAENYVYCANGWFHVYNVSLDLLSFTTNWLVAVQHFDTNRNWAGMNSGLEALEAWDGQIDPRLQKVEILGEILQTGLTEYETALRVTARVARDLSIPLA